MKTLLRKVSSGLYFQGPDKWTGNPAQALNFRSIDRALKFIETWKLREVELAFAFNDSRHVTAVPLERTMMVYSEE